MPEISVILPVFNSEEFIGKAIESVLAQTFEDFELIIVNDGSTDSSKDIIDSFIDDRIRSQKQCFKDGSGKLCDVSGFR